MEDIIVTSSPSEVSLIKTWGDDTEVARAAMVLERDDPIEEEKAYHLVDGLGHDGHWGCFEHSGATLLLRVPIFTARQIIRSRTASYNEYLLRYKRMVPRFYVPANMFTDIKRAELGDAPEIHPQGDLAILWMIDHYKATWALYRRLVDNGFRKEQARAVLPLGAFTEFWMTANIRNWLHFLNLRMDAHAQLEARDVGNKAHAILAAHFPVALSVWEKYGRGPLGLGPIQTP